MKSTNEITFSALCSNDVLQGKVSLHINIRNMLLCAQIQNKIKTHLKIM